MSLSELKYKTNTARAILGAAGLFKYAHQVVWEYVSNELQYRDKSIKAKIFVKLEKDKMQISGNGSGMNYKDLENFFTLHGENLERKSLSSAWVKALEKEGILISISPLSPSSLTEWIKNKGKEQDIEIKKEAGLLLAEKTEGNLMATMQEIRKLSLAYPSEQIDLEKMKRNITDSSNE